MCYSWHAITKNNKTKGRNDHNKWQFSFLGVSPRTQAGAWERVRLGRNNYRIVFQIVTQIKLLFPLSLFASQAVVDM
jgi:hypothetical protein